MLNNKNSNLSNKRQSNFCNNCYESHASEQSCPDHNNINYVKFDKSIRIFIKEMRTDEYSKKDIMKHMKIWIHEENIDPNKDY